MGAPLHRLAQSQPFALGDNINRGETVQRLHRLPQGPLLAISLDQEIRPHVCTSASPYRAREDTELAGP